MTFTTCPLDCFDGCSIEVDEKLNLKGEKSHPITQGYLCHHLNNYHKFPRIQNARLHGIDISLDEAMAILSEKLKTTEPKNTLFFKGSGNLGIMQSVTKLFFSTYGATVAKGSLCEDAGAYGIEEGRGANLVLSPEHVAKSEVVILWGRNPSVTNSHMLPALKGKTIIVIDPYKTDFAKKAALHVQIKPRSDIYLALLLARVAYMEQMEDEEFIEERCENFDFYIDFVNGIPMRTLMNRAGVSLNDIGEILSLLEGKKVSILVGLGVQKYKFGHSVLRSIDSFAALLGQFGREGCGVGFIADSAYGFESPFKVKLKTVPLPTVDFGKFDLVFIQGGNPVNQMPCTPKVKEGLEKAKFVVYFGLHENETSKMADLILPAKSFLEKEDLKLSYGHEYIGDMPRITECDFGISEYELTAKLNQEFDFAPLKSEKEYIDSVKNSNSMQRDGRLISKTYEEISYAKEFYTDSGKFEFMDEFYDEFKQEDLEEGFYLLSAKHNKSLNSQFSTEEFLHVPTCLNLKDNQKVKLSNGKYECEYVVKVDENLRDDCLLLYSGGKNANMLTPYAKSDEGECAVFQEVKVKFI